MGTDLKCLLDLDGVLADFVSAVCRAHFRKNPFLRKENHGKYFMHELWNISENDFWKPLCGLDFWANVPMMPDAHEILKVVEDFFGIDNICILTSPSADPLSASGKLAWIQKHLPDYRRRFLIGPRKEFCAGPRRVLLDDWEKNTDAFNKAGGIGFIVPRRWNRMYFCCDKPVAPQLEIDLGSIDIELKERKHERLNY